MDILELKKKHREEEYQYKKDYWDKLQSYLNTCGFNNVDVIHVSTGEIGRIMIQAKSYDSVDPCEFKFYRYKKDGELSKQSTGYLFSMYGLSDEKVIQTLQGMFSVKDGGATQ